MDLKLRQLEVFVSVARAASFTAASRELRTSQSALSRTIADIERTLGIRVLDRTTRSVQLLPAGNELLAIAERTLATHRAGMAEMGRYLTGDHGTITVAALPSIAALLLPPTISQFRLRWPGASVRILDGLAATVLAAVATGKADIALCVAATLPEGWRAEPFARDRFSAAVPPNSPLAGRRRINWSDFNDKPFVTVASESSVRLHIDAVFIQHSVRPARIIETGSVAAVGGLVAAGLGMTALPSLVRGLVGFADITDQPMAGPLIERQLDIVLPADRPLPPVARNFVELLLDRRDRGAHLPAGVQWTGTAA